ncbi:hypothetical protein C8R43DRAFT_966017 [Mycena crocata]|nr:hypothetical protein C8R43DRAFT_966017 [Mycena crocata]
MPYGYGYGWFRHRKAPVMVHRGSRSAHKFATIALDTTTSSTWQPSLAMDIALGEVFTGVFSTSDALWKSLHAADGRGVALFRKVFVHRLESEEGTALLAIASTIEATCPTPYLGRGMTGSCVFVYYNANAKSLGPPATPPHRHHMGGMSAANRTRTGPDRSHLMHPNAALLHPTSGGDPLAGVVTLSQVVDFGSDSDSMCAAWQSSSGSMEQYLYIPEL